MELTIEKLVYGGDGLARVAAADRLKTVFVPYVLPDERIEATILEEKPGFARASLDKVLQSSPLRTEAPCQYFARCGGCHYQHTGYDEQLRLKSEILRETLHRTGKLELDVEIHTHASPPLHYRNRARFHVQTKPEFAIGYFRHGSHQLLPVDECPISSPLINRTLSELWAAGANESLRGVREIELFADGHDQHVMLELYVDEAAPADGDRVFAHALTAKMPEIQGISAFSKMGSSVRSELLFGEASLSYRVRDESYRVSAGAFFQTNRHMVSRMVELAVGQRRGRVALDLYSGVGLFAVPLARRFERTIAVESAPISAADLRVNARQNVKVSSQTTEAYLTSTAGKLRPDLVVADPPRAGLGTEVCGQINLLSARELVYVSCDPATLARDLKQLTSAGWTIEAMHLVDLFPQTFHIESVMVLKRE